MISARQAKNMVEYMFTSGSDFTPPTATFVAMPDLYSTSTIPGGITLSGTITLNDGTLTSWSIMSGSTVLATGAGVTVSHNLVSIPVLLGSYNYHLVVNYTDNQNVAQSIIVPEVIQVTQDALIGALPNPGDDIIIPTDLTPAIEATLTITTQAGLINLFPVTPVSSGRIVFVVPSSYGTLSRIEDNASLDVTNQFNVVLDPSNNRNIYVSVNAVTAGTYNYKLVF